jgi:UDP-sugar pyrophosphorylase
MCRSLCQWSQLPTPVLSFYIQPILALEQKSHAARPMPLAIMTSDDTHSRTLDLLKKNHYFGADPEQVCAAKVSHL